MCSIRQSIVSLATAIALTGFPTWATAQEQRTATFVVHCYDVGRTALQGQKGIIGVKSGWMDRREVNRVTYDPDRINRQTIEEHLRRAGTYIETVEEQQ